MRALTLTQSRGREALAYLSGVIHGDGWLTGELALRVADRDFADTFAFQIEVAFGLPGEPRKDERGYWLIRRSNQSGRFNSIRAFQAETNAERAYWLRGLFDSEGNANVHRVKGGPNCWVRRIAMYSTAIDTLHRARSYLDYLGIPTYLRPTKNSAGHKGTKIVHELSLRSSVGNYGKFRDIIGSSIARKRKTMDEIVSSYSKDITAARRAGQIAGARTRARKSRDEVVPRVVAAIRKRIIDALPITQRACEAAIEGYATARNHHKHADLVDAAKGGGSFGP